MDYQTQFEKLLIRAGRLTLTQQVIFSVSSLKEGIKTDVQASKPNTLSVSIGLARLYEDHNQSFKRVSQMLERKPSTNRQPTSGTNTIPVKKLNPAELKEKERRDCVSTATRSLDQAIDVKDCF